MDVVQGITEITPTYTKVEGLLVKNAYVWDMRINTSSIPRDILTKIFLRHIDQTDPDDRLRVVKLYIQAERYRDALAELNRVMSDFPESASTPGDGAPVIRRVSCHQLHRRHRSCAPTHPLVGILLSSAR